MRSRSVVVTRRAHGRSAASILLSLVALVGIAGSSLLSAAPSQASDVAAVPSGSSAPVGECSQVVRDAVTFSFDAAYACGSFANGDPWVAPGEPGGAVTVVGISPSTADGLNGWMVNPASKREHGYDRRVGGFVPALVPALPYAARGGQSLVKGVSTVGPCGNRTGHPPCLDRAVVLTVLDSAPQDGGASLFRPPYFGTDKPLRSVTALRADLLPSLPPVTGAPSLAQVEQRFSRVQLDHLSSWQGRYLHPAASFRSFDPSLVSNYGADLARDNNDAALRLMLDDPFETKLPALVDYVQAGLDWYATSRGGVTYHADGGHFIGRKVAIAFAGVLLDDPDIKAQAGAGVFSEDGHVYYSPTAGRALFGKNCRAGTYETVLAGGAGGRDCRDPHGEIDGGEKPGSVYQACCTARAYKASSLVARLLPGGVSAWNNPHFHDYVDRWVDFGAWTAPDSHSRFLSLHGSARDGGNYGSAFQNRMWRAYRPASPNPPQPAPDVPDPGAEPAPSASPTPTPTPTPTSETSVVDCPAPGNGHSAKVILCRASTYRR